MSSRSNGTTDIIMGGSTQSYDADRLTLHGLLSELQDSIGQHFDSYKPFINLCRTSRATHEAFAHGLPNPGDRGFIRSDRPAAMNNSLSTLRSRPSLQPNNTLRMVDIDVNVNMEGSNNAYGRHAEEAVNNISYWIRDPKAQAHANLPANEDRGVYDR